MEFSLITVRGAFERMQSHKRVLELIPSRRDIIGLRDRGGERREKVQRGNEQHVRWK